jgi:hypothetical protein
VTREELLTLLRAARPPHPGVQILVVGSQSVLGAFPDSDLPQRATLSLEADVMYLRQGRFDQELTDMVDAWFGEGSQFHEQHGVYLQGVDEETCVLPSGWQDRLVHLVDLPAPDGPAHHEAAGTASIPVFCLDPHDLAVAKLAAGRPKDLEFVSALLTSGHLEQAEVAVRAQQLDATTYPGARSDVARRLRAALPAKEG